MVDQDKELTLYFSAPKFTVKLKVKNRIITEAAPFIRAFKGQDITNLVLWAKSTFGGPIVIKVLDEEQKPSLADLLKQVIKEYRDVQRTDNSSHRHQGSPRLQQRTHHPR